VVPVAILVPPGGAYDSGQLPRISTPALLFTFKIFSPNAGSAPFELFSNPTTH